MARSQIRNTTHLSIRIIMHHQQSYNKPTPLHNSKRKKKEDHHTAAHESVSFQENTALKPFQKFLSLKPFPKRSTVVKFNDELLVAEWDKTELASSVAITLSSQQ